MSRLGLGITLNTAGPIASTPPGSNSVMSFTGTAPNTITTPDQAGFDTPAGFELTIIEAAPTDRVGVQSFVARRTEAGDNRSWLLNLHPSGVLQTGIYNAAGTASTDVYSSAPPWAANSEVLSIRVRYVADNGASGRTTTFWYSTDSGENWTLLSSHTVAGVALVNDRATVMAIGGYNSGYTSPWGGTMRSVLLTDLAGDPIVEADPSAVADPSSGTWVSPTTGETWTAAGNASIISL